MYEDVVNAGLKIGNAKFDDVWFTHYEGMSWYQKTGNSMLSKVREERMNHYIRTVRTFEHIDLRGRFV